MSTIQFIDAAENNHSTRKIFYDMSKLDFEILEVKKFSIPKWINESSDYSDILQIKFRIR